MTRLLYQANFTTARHCLITFPRLSSPRLCVFNSHWLCPCGFLWLGRPSKMHFLLLAHVTRHLLASKGSLLTTSQRFGRFSLVVLRSICGLGLGFWRNLHGPTRHLPGHSAGYCFWWLDPVSKGVFGVVAWGELSLERIFGFSYLGFKVFSINWLDWMSISRSEFVMLVHMGGAMIQWCRTDFREPKSSL